MSNIVFLARFKVVFYIITHLSFLYFNYTVSVSVDGSKDTCSRVPRSTSVDSKYFESVIISLFKRRFDKVFVGV